jgi:Ran GTPase-activating protein (RanGAP) involved in mRNA processing and transport
VRDIGDLAKAYGALGNLEALILRSGKMKLGTIVLPKLKLLAIITGGFDKTDLAAIEKALLPSLETLTLTFGADRYGCDVGAKDLRKLLASDRFPRLTRLGLANADFADELAEMLHTSSLVAQVKSLDLSMGTLSDLGAYRIATYAAAYAHLEELDVSDSYLSKRGIALLKKALPNTAIDTSHQRLREGNEFEERYVSISE